MSIKCMQRVWELSNQKGGSLLIMLAIADNADDDGYAWPNIRTLAKKTRLNERHLKRAIQQIELSGELLVSRNEGKLNQYIVKTGLTDDAIKETIKIRNFAQARIVKKKVQNVTGDKMSRVTFDTKTGDISCNHMIRTHHEPSNSLAPPSAVAALPPLPTGNGNGYHPHQPPNKHQEFLELFASIRGLEPVSFEEGRYSWSRLAKDVAKYWNSGVTTDRIKHFALWWATVDYRGRSGTPPTMNQINQYFDTAQKWFATKEQKSEFKESSIFKKIANWKKEKAEERANAL